jgi:Fe-S oxidoreductase
LGDHPGVVLAWGSGKDGEHLATGYSCRSQVKRMADRQMRHPLEVVLERLLT